MPTSVHLPKPLLEAVDRRARALQISRNQLVVRALEREVGGDWIGHRASSNSWGKSTPSCRRAWMS